MRRAALALFLSLALWPATALAVLPDEILADPVLEARARALSANIRCLVCQNESIDSSNADLARDLRILVRERLVAGDSDQEVLDYLVARYGDFVLFKPPLKPTTYLLWFGPAILLGLGAVSLWLYFRRRTLAPAEPLDGRERARLAELLDEGETRHSHADGKAPPDEP